MAQRHDRRTLDLFDWQPPVVAVRFEDEAAVRAASVAGRLSRAVSVTLKEAANDREAVATAMSEYTGEDISKHMLDAYASQARETHNITLVRAFGLLHATGDARIFGTELRRFDLAVIPARYLAAVEEAQWADQEERARQKRQAARSRWKGA
jgi:hypothetical protein